MSLLSPLVPLLVLAACTGSRPARTAAPSPGVEGAVRAAQTASYVFDRTPGTAERPIPVWYHRPEGAGPDAPVVLVIHGMGRNADGYLEGWIPEADRHGFVVVVPEFSDEHYPGSRTYNLGNVLEDGRAVPPAAWSFSAIEPIFDDVRARLGLTADDYALYGHSAGSQFVHRFLMFVPDARARVVVAANAGWYTLPTDTAAFPYGLGGLQERFGRDGASFARPILERPVVVLLGTADTVTTSSSLRRTPEALAQGPHRLARGHRYFAEAESAARRLGVPFRWRLETVEGVGHSNSRMAPAAARVIARELGLPGSASVH